MPGMRAIEDRLEIYNLIASHPPSADTGADYYTRVVYTQDGSLDFEVTDLGDPKQRASRAVAFDHRERQKRCSPGADIRVTAEAEGRLGSGQHLALVARKTRGVTGELRDVRKAAGRDPIRRRHHVTA